MKKFHISIGVTSIEQSNGLLIRQVTINDMDKIESVMKSSMKTLGRSL